MADPALIDSIAGRIAGIESGGGNYAALGPTTDKGDRAYGKYQIMGSNIPSWTQEALGKPLTPEQFLADQDAQEKTAKHRMGVYLDEYGTPEDVASMWHSGLPYKEAVARGRKDQLGTTTESYGARVREGVGEESALAAPPAFVDDTPDPSRLSAFFADPNVPQEAKDQVGKAMRAKIGGGVATPTPEPAIAPPPEPTVAPADVPTPASATPARDTDVDQSAMDTNTFYGLSPDNKFGKYAAALGKPAADALYDVYKGLTQDAPAEGDPTALATWGDVLDRSLKLLHPFAVPAEAAGNVAFQALTDAGASPEWAGALGTIASVIAGYKTPGIKSEPVPKMPLQGTAATRAAAAETGALATQADEAVAAARAAEEAAVQRGEGLTAQAETAATSSRAVAEDAARQAEAAAQTASPTPETAARAKAALTPAGTAATEGSAAVTGQLERELKDIKDPVQGIYNTLVDTAEAEHRSLDPSNYKSISEQIAALKNELGPTLSGQSKAVIENVENQINTGQRLGAKLLDEYKQQLDTLFPGRVPHGATPKQRALYDFKWNVRDMMRSMYDGEEKQWAEAADALWRDTIIGKDSPTALGNLVKLAKKNPRTFAERVFGSGTADKQGVYAKAVMQHLDDAGKAQVRESVLSRAMDNATDPTTGNLDPSKLLTNISRYTKDFYDAVISKEADSFFKVLRQEQAAVGETATAAKRGAQWASAAESEAASTAKAASREASAAGRAVTAAEREAGAAKSAAEKASEEATKPNRLAHLTAKGLEIGVAEIAGRLGVHVPGGGVIGLLIPSNFLAKALADSKTANLLTRALKMPANAKAGVALIEALRNRNTSVNFLSGEQPQESK